MEHKTPILHRIKTVVMRYHSFVLKCSEAGENKLESWLTPSLITFLPPF